jgi:predicted O-methyltransferase YrrM
MFSKIKKLIQDWNAARELQKYAPLLRKDAQDLDAKSLVDLLYSPKWERFFWIKQLRDEVEELSLKISDLKPKIIVEIGTNLGGSLFIFTKLTHPEALIISIDLPGGVGGGGYEIYRANFYHSFTSPLQVMHLLRMDSHQLDTFTTLKKLLNGQLIDFLFLDGDHSYEGIKQDFEMYSPLVRSGGLIGFHDIKPSAPDNWIQVDKFFNEIKLRYKYTEIISDMATWGGIGIIEK